MIISSETNADLFGFSKKKYKPSTRKKCCYKVLFQRYSTLFEDAEELSLKWTGSKSLIYISGIINSLKESKKIMDKINKNVNTNN